MAKVCLRKTWEMVPTHWSFTFLTHSLHSRWKTGSEAVGLSFTIVFCKSLENSSNVYQNKMAFSSPLHLATSFTFYWLYSLLTNLRFLCSSFPCSPAGPHLVLQWFNFRLWPPTILAIDPLIYKCLIHSWLGQPVPCRWLPNQQSLSSPSPLLNFCLVPTPASRNLTQHAHYAYAQTCSPHLE